MLSVSKITFLYFFFSDGDYDVSMTQQRIQELNKHIYLLELNSRKPVHGSGGRYRLQTNGTLSIRQVWSLTHTYLHLSKGPISDLQQHNRTQVKEPLFGHEFHALLHGVIRFVAARAGVKTH